MPNGQPDEWRKIFPEVETFFNKIAHVLEDFGNKHNLIIDKYYHEGADWTFRFRHPRGGIAGIQVNYLDSEHVNVGAGWQIAEYDTCTLLSKHTDMEKCSLEEGQLASALLHTLETVLSWKKADLIVVKGHYSEWKEIRKEEFEKQDEKYPIPKVD